MASVDSFGAKGTLDVKGKAYEIFRLDAVSGEGVDVASLPFSLKVLLENLLRTEDGADITADDIRFLGAWDADAQPDKEIQYTPARVIMRLPYKSDFLRPGGTIGGPLLMGLADVSLYAVLMAAAGPVVAAVTSNLNINFLRKPAPAPVIAEAHLLKLGKRLAVGEVAIYTEGDPEMVAHVTATYSLPPSKVS